MTGLNPIGQILEETISIGFQDQSHKPLDHLSLRPIYLIISPTLRLELTYEFFLTCNGINFTKEVIANLSKKVKVSWLLSAVCIVDVLILFDSYALTSC